jgi:putative molybdopterin biosynthesis protein
VGSGARQCLDELRADHRPPRRLARDHRGVAEAIRCGWADAGVCLRLTSEEAGLDFLSVRQEHYDLCYAAAMEEDPRIKAMVSVVRSESYRRLMGELSGYATSEVGDIQTTA